MISKIYVQLKLRKESFNSNTEMVEPVLVSVNIPLLILSHRGRSR